ncbi:hypothetical protein Taro_050739 [Colocasia esculenta]|uniref:Uncharacterized protein n=1 Tax=Colocasia esculenta TaxID=4460 RepID=A0A843XES2_COLES|nr:hypothetical protein [Colocasia esculenta]
MEDAPIEGEQLVAEEIQGEISVASGHTEVPLAETPVHEEVAAAAHSDVPMENVPVEEEFLGEKDGETQGEGNEHPPENQFRDGETASSSDSEEDQDQQPPVDKAREKGKAAASEVPLIADTPFQRQMRQRFIINLKPVIERLDAQGEILCSVQSDVNSIFMSQASTSKELSQVKNAVRWFNKEMGSMKSMLSEILKAVGAQAPPPPPPPTAQRSEEDVPRPSGPAEQVAGPSGPAVAASQAEELKAKQNFYPISIERFLVCASFGTVTFFKMSLDRDAYANFLEDQLAVYLKRMAPTMGPTYSLAPGVFRSMFEKQEE